MIKLSLSVQGVNEAQLTLKQADSRLSDMSPFYESVAKHEFEVAQRRIREGGSPAWPATKFPSSEHPMLRRTGELYNSLDPDQPVNATNTGVEFGTDVPYAPFVQFGVAAGKMTGAGSPGRPFLYFDSEDLKWIVDRWYDWVLRGELVTT